MAPDNPPKPAAEGTGASRHHLQPNSPRKRRSRTTPPASPTPTTTTTRTTAAVNTTTIPDQQPRETKAQADPTEGYEAHIPLPPDGGWGWVVVVASMICNIILDGINYSFGVFLLEFVDYFQESKSKVSLVGSLLSGTYNVNGPVVSALTNKFGCRPVTVAGSVVAGVAFLLSTMAPSVDILILTYGVMGGFGLGMMYLPSIVSVGYYFEKKRALATGIAVCGSGIGTFIFAPLSEYLLQELDWKNALMLISGITLNAAVCGMLMRPLQPARSRRRPRASQPIKSKSQRSPPEKKTPRYSMGDTGFVTEDLEVKLQALGSSLTVGPDARTVQQQQQQQQSHHDVFSKMQMMPPHDRGMVSSVADIPPRHCPELASGGDSNITAPVTRVLPQLLVTAVPRAEENATEMPVLGRRSSDEDRVESSFWHQRWSERDEPEAYALDNHRSSKERMAETSVWEKLRSSKEDRTENDVLGTSSLKKDWTETYVYGKPSSQRDMTDTSVLAKPDSEKDMTETSVLRKPSSSEIRTLTPVLGTPGSVSPGGGNDANCNTRCAEEPACQRSGDVYLRLREDAAPGDDSSPVLDKMDDQGRQSLASEVFSSVTPESETTPVPLLSTKSDSHTVCVPFLHARNGFLTRKSDSDVFRFLYHSPKDYQKTSVPSDIKYYVQLPDRLSPWEVPHRKTTMVNLGSEKNIWRLKSVKTPVVGQSLLSLSVSKKDLARPLYRKDIFYSGSVHNLPLFRSQPDMKSYITSITTIPGETAIMAGGEAKVWSYLCFPQSCKDTLQEMLDFSLLRNTGFLLICLGNVLAFLGFYVPFVYSVDLAVSLGINKSRAALLISVIGITNTLGRVVTGWLADLRKINSLVITYVSFFICGLSTTIFPFCNTYGLLCAAASLFGLSVAGFISVSSILICDLLGLEKLTNGFGLLSLFRGVAAMAGPPLAGFVHEQTRSYKAAFFLGGCLLTAGALCHLSIRLPCARTQEPEAKEIAYVVVDSPAREDTGTGSAVKPDMVALEEVV